MRVSRNGTRYLTTTTTRSSVTVSTTNNDVNTINDTIITKPVNTTITPPLMREKPEVPPWHNSQRRLADILIQPAQLTPLQLAHTNIVYFDLESTGLDVRRDNIIEIGVSLSYHHSTRVQSIVHTTDSLLPLISLFPSQKATIVKLCMICYELIRRWTHKIIDPLNICVDLLMMKWNYLLQLLKLLVYHDVNHLLLIVTFSFGVDWYQ
jgi:hypothetical protein